MLKTIVGRQVRFYRRSKKYTIEEAANRSSVGQLGKIELGQWNPTLKTLALLAYCLDVKLYDLFDEGDGRHTTVDYFLQRTLPCTNEPVGYQPEELLEQFARTPFNKITVQEIEIYGSSGRNEN